MTALRRAWPERVAGCFVVEHALGVAIADAVDAAGRELHLQKPLWRMHEEATPRLCRLLGDQLAQACRAPPLAELFDRFARDVGLSLWRRTLVEKPGERLVRQLDPCVRVNPPQRPDLAVPFHTDAWAGNPPQQTAVWIALVDIEGDEGLWITADDVSARCFSGPEARMADVQAEARAASRPVPMKRGSCLFFDGHVGHGSIAHAVARTRVSVDFRVCLASQVLASGWTPRSI